MSADTRTAEGSTMLGAEVLSYAGGQCPLKEQYPSQQLADEQKEYLSYDYDEELEDCRQYTFSDAPYSPEVSRIASQEALGIMSGDGTSDGLSSKSWPTLFPQKPAFMQSTECSWSEKQELINALHHKAEQARWCQRMSRNRAMTEEQRLVALRILIGEACRRDLQRLRAHAKKHDSPDNAAAYIRAKRQWKSFAAKAEQEFQATPDRLQSFATMMQALRLFNFPPDGALRDFNTTDIDVQNQGRCERAYEVLRTLKAQGVLFVLVPLHAEEIMDPTPVVATADEDEVQHQQTRCQMMEWCTKHNDACDASSYGSSDSSQNDGATECDVSFSSSRSLDQTSSGCDGKGWLVHNDSPLAKRVVEMDFLPRLLSKVDDDFLFPCIRVSMAEGQTQPDHSAIVLFNILSESVSRMSSHSSSHDRNTFLSDTLNADITGAPCHISHGTPYPNIMLSSRISKDHYQLQSPWHPLLRETSTLPFRGDCGSSSCDSVKALLQLRLVATLECQTPLAHMLA